MQAEGRAVAFIDRDGVINEDPGHVHRIWDFRFLPGAIDGLKTLLSCGFDLVVVTNQAGIAKGLYNEAAYQLLTAHMRAVLAEAGVALLDVRHCPHHPEGVIAEYTRTCDCRKPAPGLILAAARDHAIDLQRSVLIGDKLSDIAAGQSAGVALSVLVGPADASPQDVVAHPDHVAPDLAGAARWVCSVAGRRHGVWGTCRTR